MATTTTAETTTTPRETPAETPDSPLLDMSDQAVKRMIKTAKQRGYVTYDELNEVLPSDEVSSEQIEDTMSMLSEMGINVVDSEEPEEASASSGEDGEEEVRALPVKVEKPASTQLDRTDDPVRMYLREMGSVELLSREGEIAIAKRIEAGREAMIAGLCESPLTFQAIIIWRDELNEGGILLRDIIDLEATYAGPDAKQAPAVSRPDADGEAGAAPDAAPGANGAAAAAPGANGAAAAAPAPESADDEDPGDTASEDDDDDDDDDDGENSLSLAAFSVRAGTGASPGSSATSATASSASSVSTTLMPISDSIDIVSSICSDETSSEGSTSFSSS